MPECEACGRAPHPGMSCFAAEPKYPDDFPFPMADVWRDYYSYRFGDGKRVSNPPVTVDHSPRAKRPEPPITLVIQSPVKGVKGQNSPHRFTGAVE